MLPYGTSKKGLREKACSQLIKTHDTLSRIFLIKHANFLQTKSVQIYYIKYLDSVYLKESVKVYLDTEEVMC